MAKIGTQDLARVPGGSALRLNLRASPEQGGTIPLQSGWEVELQSDSEYVVARTDSNLSYNDSYKEGYASIQQSLDFLSFAGRGTLVTEDVRNERLVEWCKDGKQIIRIVGVGDLGIKVGSHDQRPSQTISHHDSMRYYRNSQTTNELFDAFRNIFLGVEHVLSDRTPQKSSEGNRNWLERAFTQAHSDIDLSRYAADPSNVVDSIMDQQYETRNEMFHAKTGRSRLSPQNQTDRNRVEDALDNLTPMLLSLIQDTTGLVPSVGYMTTQGFRYQHKRWMDGMSRMLFNDQGGTESDTISDPNWQNATQIQTQYDPSLCEPGLEVVIGSENVSSVTPATLRSIGLVTTEPDPDLLVSIHDLKQKLDLTELDVVEAVMGFRLTNLNSYKTRYPI